MVVVLEEEPREVAVDFGAVEVVVPEAVAGEAHLADEVCEVSHKPEEVCLTNNFARGRRRSGRLRCSWWRARRSGWSWWPWRRHRKEGRPSKGGRCE